MKPRQQQKEALFEAVRHLTSPVERTAYLDRACGHDPELRRELDAMLQADAAARAYFQTADFPADPCQENECSPSVPPDAPLAEGPGTLIGRYKLLQQIGEGGFGVVYMAEQQEPVIRKVALKIIKLGLDTREVVARFEAERQALALMEHPNIAQVFDGGATETGRPYFVMELVKGIPVTQFCDEYKLPTAQRLTLFAEVCSAIQHAHQKGVIHRDLKPSNILVTLHGDKPVPKVIDFGIAKATQQRLTDKTLFTHFQQFIGTPAYMSPEQASLSGLDVDTRSDIYSLGVLLYELLTSRTPFDARVLRQAGYEEMRRIIREEDPPRPSIRLSTLQGEERTTAARARQADPHRLGGVVRGELDWIVMKALEKDRTRRYETANGLAMDIQRYLHDEPVLAVAPSARYRMTKFVRRHRAGLAVTAALFGMLVAGVIVSSWQMVRARQAEKLAANRLKEVEKERQAAVTARGQAEAVSEFLVEAFRSPDPTQKGRTVTVAEVLSNAVQKLEGKFTEAPERKAALLLTLGTTYHALGRYKEAERLIEESIVLRERLLGRKHRDTLRAMYQLAAGYLGQERWTEAHQLITETLELRRQVLGATHVETLKSMNHLARVYRGEGRLAEAAKLHGETLELQRQILGPEHWETLNSMLNLATTYLDQRRLDEAEKLFKEVLPLERRVVGAEHPMTLATMNNFANVYDYQGRWDEMEQIYKEVLEIGRRVMGPEHPNTLASLYNLARTYVFQQRLEEAEPLYRECYETERKVFGAGDRRTLVSMLSLADVYEKLGKLDQAVALRLEHLKARPADPDSYSGALATIEKVTSRADRVRHLARFADICAEAFTNQTKLADDLNKGVRYLVACGAAAAAAPQTETGASLVPAEQSRLRALALGWLQADLALWTARFDTNAPMKALAIEEALTRWQRAEELASIRDPQALSALPEMERELFAKLWTEVAALHDSAQRLREQSFVILLAQGSRWAYWDSRSDPGIAWLEPGFDDAAWKRGPSPLGYGDPGMATTVDSGPDKKITIVTTYFRSAFALERPEQYSGLALRLRRDDGAAIYLNGKEVLRDNLPAEGPLTPGTLALKSIGGQAELTYNVHELATVSLRSGTNTVAVEVHQSERTSSDLAFDLEILALRRK